MKRITIALMAVTTLASGAMAIEQPGASARSPGHEMKSGTTGPISRTDDAKSGTAGTITRR